MPSLLTVTGEKIDLAPNRAYLLGRGSDCDVVVTDMASSRHHARITVGGQRQTMFIEDLSSRNGTLVNEERISGRTHLKDGNRIRIGATVYLVREEDGSAEKSEQDLLDTGTVALERLSLGGDVDEKLLRAFRRVDGSNTEFAGQLASFPLIEVLQLLMQTHRSGTLNMEVEDGHASVEIRNGDVMNAAYQEMQGFAALLMLVNLKAGIFWLVERITPCTRNIHEPPARLLFELCRALDEQG